MKRLHARLVRNIIVPIVMTCVIGFPFLSQPLGLFRAPNSAQPQPVSGSETTSTAADADAQDSCDVTPAEGFDYFDVAFNRAYNNYLEYLVIPDAPTPSTPVDIDIEEEYEWYLETWLLVSTTDPLPEPVVPSYIKVDYMLYIAANKLNLRAGASLEAEILTTLKFGDKVQCIGENPEWTMVMYKDQVGFVKTEYTSQTMVFKPVKQTVYVDANKLNLRKDPTTDSEIITTLTYETRLTRTGIGDGWSEVRTSSGKTGYVSSQYITPNPPSLRTGNQEYSDAVISVVNLAYSALGVPYVHAGSSMSGFDCSGLVSWVYRQIGIAVPRSTSGYYNIGTSVSYKNLYPGDIICMDTRSSDGISSITHVSIYVGNGLMIHASSNKGKVVLQNVSQYLSWGVKLITIRRMIN